MMSTKLNEMKLPIGFLFDDVEQENLEHNDILFTIEKEYMSYSNRRKSFWQSKLKVDGWLIMITNHIIMEFDNQFIKLTSLTGEPSGLISLDAFALMKQYSGEKA